MRSVIGEPAIKVQRVEVRSKALLRCRRRCCPRVLSRAFFIYLSMSYWLV